MAAANNGVQDARPTIRVGGDDKPALAQGLLGLLVAEHVSGLYRCEARFGPAEIIGPEFAGRARILPPQQSGPAKDAINSKYFLARLSLWNSKNEYLEIQVVG